MMMIILLISSLLLVQAQIQGKAALPPASVDCGPPLLRLETEHMRRHLGYINLAHCAEKGAIIEYTKNQNCDHCHWSAPQLMFQAVWKGSAAGSTSGFVALDRQTNTIVTAIVGELPNSIKPDSLSVPEDDDLSCPECRIHDVMLDEYDRVVDFVHDDIVELRARYPTATLVFAGHHFGAGLATLMAMRYTGKNERDEQVSLFTTGEPPIGDSKFVLRVDQLFHANGAMTDYHRNMRRRRVDVDHVRQVYRLVSLDDFIYNSTIYESKQLRTFREGYITVQTSPYGTDSEDMVYAFDGLVLADCLNPDTPAVFHLDTAYMEPLGCEAPTRRRYMAVAAPTPPTATDTIPLVDPNDTRNPVYHLY